MVACVPSSGMMTLGNSLQHPRTGWISKAILDAIGSFFMYQKCVELLKLP